MNRRDLMRSGFVAAGALAFPIPKVLAFASERSLTVVRGLEDTTGKAIGDITADDLRAIETLYLPHVHIDTFFDVDFQGLVNLRDLSFRSVFHSVPALPETVFASVPSLEWLGLEFNQFLDLPDEVFAPLTGLETLDLTRTRFTSLPTSLFQFTSLESIVTVGLDRTQYQLLRDHYGDIVVG